MKKYNLIITVIIAVCLPVLILGGISANAETSEYGSQEKETVKYKGRVYTKRRFERLVEQLGLVQHNGEWITKHEMTGVELAKDPDQYNMQDILKYASPAVVSIKVDDKAVASGVFISSNGIILTNYHVVKDAKKIMVTLYGSESEYRARTARVKEFYDLALLSVGGSDYPSLKLADPESIKLGETVIAVGNPFGLSATASSGIISSMRRLKDMPGAKEADLSIWQEEITLIQTDAAVNPGNSGGPLLNEKGEIVGINTFGVPKTIAEGLNFAVHAKELKKNFPQYFD